jgi:hypothetical protein
MTDISRFGEPSESKASADLSRFGAPEKPLGQKAMEYFVTPALEAVGTVGGGAIGGIGGTAVGPVGTALGTVAGAGTGYATGKKLGELAEEALGYRKSPTASEAVKQSVKDIATGAEYEVGGRALGAGAEAIYSGAKKIPEAYRTLRGFPYKKALGELTTRAEDLAKQLIEQTRGSGRELYGAQRQARLSAQKDAEVAMSQIDSAKKALGASEDLSVTGNKLMSDIKDVSDKSWGQRKELADKTYSSAWQSTRAKQAAGDYWQTSPSGKNFFNTLENKIATSDVTPVSSAEEKEIRALINELRGKEVGETKGFAFDPTTGFMSTPSIPKFAPLDIKPVVEQLRRLRDAANGFPEEGFKAISQKRAKAMAESIEKSIAKWDDSLRKADKTYKAMSERLYPEQTARGEAILARQRYDLNELARDPKNATKLFFSSKQGVEDLTRLLGGDKQKVAQYARQHTINEISTKKTAKEAETWVTSKSNSDWLNEFPQLRREVETYVDTLRKAENKVGASENLAKTMKTAGRATAQEMGKTIAALQREARMFENADPSKVAGLASEFARKFEGIASPQQIAQFERQIKETERLNQGQERARKIAILAAQFAGLGAGVYGGIRYISD